MNTDGWTNERRTRDSLYGWAAMAGFLVVFIGFARTYFLKRFFGTPDLPFLLHLHGVVLTLWFVVFFVQTRLISVRRVDRHRQLGVFAAVIAGLVVLVGGAVAIHASRRGFLVNPNSMRDIRGLAILCGFLLDYSLLIGSALYFRRRADIHKRLMLLGTCSILAPAISRVPLPFIQAGGIWMIIGLLDLCALFCIGYDTIRSRKLHPAFGWGGPFLLLTFPICLFVSKSGAWIHFARWLLNSVNV
jgi:hypothetical protein